MNPIAFLVPGGPLPRTGGTLYNEALAGALERMGQRVLWVPLQGSWPLPHPDQLPAMEDALAQLTPGTPVLADGLIWTGIEPLLRRLTQRSPCTVIVHSPLFRETGLSESLSQRLHDAEAHALSFAALRVATGGPTLRDITHRFHLSAVYIPPGTDPFPAVPAAHPHALLCVATLTRRKGHDRLLRGLAGVHDLPWHLTCAGSTTIDPDWFAEVTALTDALGLQDRVEFAGELDAPELNKAFESAGLLVHAARYEAYGMALAEGIARGIPVVSTPAGALEDAATSAAVCLPDGPTSRDWAHALRLAMGPHHTTLRAAARSVQLPTWDDTAAALLRAQVGPPLSR